MKSFLYPDFIEMFGKLPAHVQELARKNYRLWAQNPQHPSLRFKPAGKSRWSVRVGDHYRVLGIRDGDTITWYWIGSHEAYNKR